MENEDTAHIRETLREWIGLDDQIRALQAQIKTLRDRKTALGGNVLEFMQGNNLDNFLEFALARQIFLQGEVLHQPPKWILRM